MPPVSDREVYGAFLAALNESGHKYLVVGEAACTWYQGVRPVPKLEVWVEGKFTLDDDPNVIERACDKLKAARVSEEEVAKKLTLIEAMPRALFAPTYEKRVEGYLYGQRVKIVSGDDLVALKLAAGQVEDARSILHSIRDNCEPDIVPPPEPEAAKQKLRNVPKL